MLLPIILYALVRLATASRHSAVFHRADVAAAELAYGDAPKFYNVSIAINPDLAITTAAGLRIGPASTFAVARILTHATQASDRFPLRCSDREALCECTPPTVSEPPRLGDNVTLCTYTHLIPFWDTRVVANPVAGTWCMYLYDATGAEIDRLFPVWEF